VDRLRVAWWSLLVGVPIVIAYAGRAAEGKPPEDALYRYSTALNGVVQYAILLGFVLLIAGFRRDRLALYQPGSWPRAIGLSVVVFVALFIVIALLEQVLRGGEEQGLTPDGWQPEHAGAYVANFVVIAIVAPIVEELTFRGLGYSLLEPLGAWTAILLTGAIFAAEHGLVQGFLELMLFGCALAWLRMRTRSVYPGMILHSLFNGIALVVAVVPH
jgi:membrane protease YdiL (CAAX protease family)